MISDDLTRRMKVMLLQSTTLRSTCPKKYIDGDNVNKVLKVVVSVGFNEVPVVGGMLSGLLDLFWPGGDDDLWEGIKDKVERLVDEKIGEETANANPLRLKGIFKILETLQMSQRRF
ncbi:hypothetical protein J7337_012968 [Fusarium musae]|uniref:Uncharacterized protein n=1 Tax=Fusarium musae TaxID=1042133 RepID=A0A9P8D6T5_9HYPO|nr:hypothetical protein J7337_012968 [Fusarium musae]KAG9496380.1 hypothetical protein J7337_012968 [Fusarium musae]